MVFFIVYLGNKQLFTFSECHPWESSSRVHRCENHLRQRHSRSLGSALYTTRMNSSELRPGFCYPRQNLESVLARFHFIAYFWIIFCFFKESFTGCSSFPHLNTHLIIQARMCFVMKEKPEFWLLFVIYLSLNLDCVMFSFSKHFIELCQIGETAPLWI